MNRQLPNQTFQSKNKVGSQLRLTVKIMVVLISMILTKVGLSQVGHSESFESGLNPPSGWTSGGSTGYLYSTTNGVNPAQTPHSGSYQLIWQSYNAPNGSSASLATPAFDLSYRGSNTVQMSLWVYRDVSAYNTATYDQEGVYVYINTSNTSSGGTLLGFVPRRGGAAASGSYLASGVSTTATSGWYQYTFNIPSGYTYTTNYLVFDFYSQYGNNTFVDDIYYTSYPNPISFYINASSPCSGNNVQFINTSTAPNAYYYSWDFGDGINYGEYYSTTVNHIYSNYGTYTIYCDVYDVSFNWIGYNYQTLTVQQGTNGVINVSKDSICPGEQVSIDPGSNGMPQSWSISDGYSSTNVYSFSHTFSSVGTYTVNAVFNTACGLDTISKTVVVSNSILPNSDFNFYPNPSVCPNSNVQVNPNVYSGTHSWNFGDGYTSVSTNPSHAYPSLGTYTISHTSTNSCGNNSTTTHTVSVDNTTYPTNANFGYYPNTAVCPGVQISFNSQNYEGQWYWNFGDGITASGQNPKHTYSAAGTYTVTHTVTNQCGNSLSTTNVITISNSIVPDGNFYVSPSTACPGDIIGFSAIESYGTNYQWNFGDGSTSSIKNPSHQYAAPGTYNVTLTVTNSCGLQNSSSQTVTISGSLPVNLTSTLNTYPQMACSTQPITFDAGAWGYASYNWDFGDGTTITNQVASTTHAYAAPGTYTAVVTVYNNCGNSDTLVKIVTIGTYVPFPNYAVNANPRVVCPGENISMSAPYGYPSYEWNMGDGSPVFTSTNSYVSYSYTTAGTKPLSVKVTDYCGNDTTYLDTINVNVGTTFCNSGTCSVSTSANTPSCPNSSVNFYATSGYAWYTWNFGDGTSLVTSSGNASHTYTAQGSYTYTVTITNFCGVDTNVYNSLDINNSQQINSWTSVYAYPDVVCPNQTVTFQTDNNYSLYQWDFGDGTIANGTYNVSHAYSTPGTYNVSVTITNACGNSSSFSTSVTVSNTATFPSWMNLSSTPNPACPGSPVSLETTAGYASYVWNFGDGSTLTSSTGLVSHVYASTGNYYASVVVTNSCGQSVTLYRTVNIQSTVTISYLDITIPNNPACVGDLVMLTPYTGGGGPGSSAAGITYVWDYGDGSPLDTTIGIGTSHTYASQGVYNVQLTATNACGSSITSSKLVTINAGASPALTQYSFGVFANENGAGYGSSVTVCPGDLLVFYFEGVNPNNLWDFGDGVTGVATDVFVRADGVTVTTIRHAYTTAGTYNYSLTLGNNCGNSLTLNKNVVVSSGMLVSGGFIIQAPSSTLGYTTCGLTNFLAFGGNSFSWNFGDGTTLTTISPLVSHSYTNPGNYTVIVTITNGCGNTASYVKTLTVNGIGGTVVSALTNISPTCYNSTNGSASVGVSGGQAPYSYVWTNSLGQTISTSDAATNLGADTYSITVTDVSGCEGTASITVTNPSAITLNINSTNSACGGASGTATVASVSGGASPYTYVWSNGQTTQTATGLALGSYTVTVTDNHSCTSSSVASVSESGATVSVASTTNNTCASGSSGAVNISVSGGLAPYTFNWSNGATSQNISGLAAGTYSVIVTDANNCQSTISQSVTAPAALSVNAVTNTSPTCGNFDGSARANVSGGTAPYTYLWPSAGNQTTQTATGLPAGTYTVEVTDANSCMQTGTVTLSNSNSPNVASVVTNVSCNGGSNGSIDLTVTGGTSPYLYTWNTGSNSQDVSGLQDGFYFVSIQDAAGCLSIRSFNLTEPAVLTASVAVVGATCGNTDGTATANPTGGTAPYTYSWSGGGQTTQTAVALALGTYTVTVTDSKGCVTNANTTISSTVIPVEICLVTVDSLSTHNIIVWDKSGLNATDSFRIYREDVTNVYTHIGTVAYDSLSEYHDYDAAANPNATTKRYKISTVDNCGNESVKSNYHNTIYIVYAGSGQFTWNPIYTIENSANPVDNYLLMRDDNGTGNWNQIQSTAGTQNTITDPAFASFPNAKYRVETSWNISCTATRGAINTSRSNIKSPNSIGIKETSNVDAFSLVPNPAHSSVIINMNNSKDNKIEIHNSLGQLVYKQTVSNKIHSINLMDYRAGVYYVTVENSLGKTVQKLVID